MSRTFSDSLKADVANVFVNTNEFAEVVSWQDRARALSDVNALIVNRPMRSVDGTKPAARRDVDGIERIAVIVSRDATATNSLVRRPEIGETITRSADRDPDSRPWVYTGTCEVFNVARAVYIFERAKRQATTRG